MTTTCCNQNISPALGLADWLVQKSNETSLSSKIAYHLVGRVALLGASLLGLAEAIGRAVLGCIAYVGYLISMGFLQQAKTAGLRQFQMSSTAGLFSFYSFLAIGSPKQIATWLGSTPPAAKPQPADTTAYLKSMCVKKGADLIADKLQRQFARTQKQAEEEKDGPFKYVAAPRDFKGEAHTEKVGDYEVGVCHYIGRRPTMEDQHLATTFNLNVMGKVYPVQIFGVFDGHGGPEAAIHVRENLQRVFLQTLERFCSKELTDENIWNALKIACVTLKVGFDQRHAGTTATIAMILDGKLWTANVGDSRTILDNGIQLSEDAKPDDPNYQNGIENRGGKVIQGRVNGILAVARAIGDHSVGAVSSRPKITVYPMASIPKGTQLILTCDGVYDVASTRQVAAATRAHRQQSAEELAKNIVYSAYQANSWDNLSALVVKL